MFHNLSLGEQEDHLKMTNNRKWKRKLVLHISSSDKQNMRSCITEGWLILQARSKKWSKQKRQKADFSSVWGVYDVEEMETQILVEK